MPTTSLFSFTLKNENGTIAREYISKSLEHKNEIETTVNVDGLFTISVLNVSLQPYIGIPKHQAQTVGEIGRICAVIFFQEQIIYSQTVNFAGSGFTISKHFSDIGDFSFKFSDTTPNVLKLELYHCTVVKAYKGSSVWSFGSTIKSGYIYSDELSNDQHEIRSLFCKINNENPILRYTIKNDPDLNATNGYTPIKQRLVLTKMLLPCYLKVDSTELKLDVFY